MSLAAQPLVIRGDMGRGNVEFKRQAQILRFWRAVEYFSPPKVDPVDPQKGIRAVMRGRRLPWEHGALDPARNNCTWRHTVYAGIFDVGKVREVLENVLRAPDAEQDFGGRFGGQSALLSFAVDSGGRLLKDSITLSSCAWAVSRTLVPGPDDAAWLTGFEADQARLLSYLFEIGDGKIPIKSGGGRVSRLVAGTASRVALDVVTGGIASLPSVLGMVTAPAVGPIAAKVIEKVGDALAKDVNDTISTAVKQKKEKEAEPGVDGKHTDESERPPDALGTKVLTVDDLAAITRWVAETLGVADALEPNAIRVKSYQVSLKSVDDVSTDDFLNSFYADDLERVANAVADGDVGGALTAYLRAEESISAARRIDLRKSPHTMLRSLQPTSMPLGRWPAEPDRPLTLSQQFSINEIFNGLKDPAARGLYAVNGPPGTGKTTMLRDMIAALVVERAMRLAKLKTARDAFVKSSVGWEVDDGSKVYKRSIFPLRSELTGFEIVVASSNNGAVENITLEVPAAKTVDFESFPDAGYLADPATLLAGTPCWGAVAARLGRRDYRREFVDRFWWGSTGQQKSQQKSSELLGLQKLLKGFEDGAEVEAPSWDDAVKQFNAAVDDVRRLANDRQGVAELLARMTEPDATLRTLREQAGNARDRVRGLQAHRNDLQRQAEAARAQRGRAEIDVADARNALASAHANVDLVSVRVQAASAALHNHASGKPGLLRRLWSRHVLSDWQEDAKPLAEVLSQADRLMGEAEARYNDYAKLLTARQRDLHEAADTERRCGDRLSQCERDIELAVTTVGSSDSAVAAREAKLQREIERLADARRQWPSTVPSTEWHAEPDDRAAMEQREMSAPWMDEEFAAARSRVFLAALDLHRAVLTAEPRLCWRNLRAVVDVVSGDAPADLPASTVLAAWQTLFFVVPVVSTTFASLSRMFSSLGREALGWLFIDEAGQAVPQAAVGAFWRTRRAVVVGDPRQLEPVLTLPWSGQKRLCRHLGVDQQWAPQNGSVQSIADRLNTFGTWLPDPDGSGYTWVGSPLRVHRRCDRLMFEVSNKIAYDGMMVYGVPQRPEFDLLTQDTWLDVRAQPTGSSKWNPVEGSYVVATLDTIRQRIARQMESELADAGTEFPEWAANDQARKLELTRRVTEAVFVVSPFRDIVDNLRKEVGSRLLSASNRLGTVHTTQGKEADIVLLVLGTATDQARSRNWASQPPNLLNVAVTRARRRLVVIGDYRNWSKHLNFEVLAAYGGNGQDSLLKVVDVSGKSPGSWASGAGRVGPGRRTSHQSGPGAGL
jgi:hypothetical protein